MNQTHTQNKAPAQRIRRIGLLTGLLLGGLGISGYAAASPAEVTVIPNFSAGIVIGINQGRLPPPPRHEPMGRAPFHDAVWVPGQWEWRNRWVWHRGQWEHRHRYYREPVYWAPPRAMYREEPRHRHFNEYRYDRDSRRYDDDRPGYRR